MRLHFCFTYSTYTELPQREILPVLNFIFTFLQSKKYLIYFEIFLSDFVILPVIIAHFTQLEKI